jgi:hypothetical protein
MPSMPSFNPALLRSGSSSPSIEQKHEKDITSYSLQQEKETRPQVDEDKEELPPLESFDHVHAPNTKEKKSSLSTCLSSTSSTLSTGQSTGEVKHPGFNSSLLTFSSNPVILQQQQPNMYHLSTPHLSSGSLNSIGHHLQPAGIPNTQAPVSTVPASPLQSSSQTAIGSNRLNSEQHAESFEQHTGNPSLSIAGTSGILKQRKSLQGTSNPVDTVKHEQPLTAVSLRLKGETGGPKYQRPMAAVFPVSSALPTHSSASNHYVLTADPVSSPEPTPLLNSVQRRDSSSSIQKRSTGSQSILASLTESLPPQAPSVSGVLSNQEFFEMLQTELKNQQDVTDNGLLDAGDDDLGQDGQADDDYKEFTRLLSDAKRTTASMNSRVIDRDIQQSASHEFVGPPGNMGVSPAEMVVHRRPTALAEELSNMSGTGVPEKTNAETGHEGEKLSHLSDVLGQRVDVHHESKGNNEGPGLTVEVISIISPDIDIAVHPGVHLVNERGENTKASEQLLSHQSNVPSVSSTNKEKDHNPGQTNETAPMGNVPAYAPEVVNARPFRTAIPGQSNDVVSMAGQASGAQAFRVPENPPAQSEHPQIGASLDFLASCFPDMDRNRLRKLLEDNQFDVESAINVILQEQAADSPQPVSRNETAELANSDEGMEMSDEDENETLKQRDIDHDPEEQLSSGLQGVVTDELDAEIAHSLNIEETPTDDMPLEDYTANEEDKPMKRKDEKQIHLDEEMARRLQAEFDNEALLKKQKAAVAHDAQTNDVGHPEIGLVLGKHAQHGAKSGKGESESPDGVVKSFGPGRMCVRLDASLVQQMQQKFGQVQFVLTPDDYVVELGDKFANKLYQKWVAGLEEKYDFDGTQRKRLMKKDEILAKKLQAEEEKLRDQEMEAKKLSQRQGAKRGCHIRKASGEKAQIESFSQIVDEQLAIEMGKEDQPNVVQKTDLASETKKQQLYAMYPSLDKQQLDELFSANE